MEMDWVWGLAGGLMIGCAGALFLLGNGRIMGASGLLGGLLDGRSDWAERLVFLAAMIAVPFGVVQATGTAQTNLTGQVWVLIAAGLMVGFGTRMANGCTSGHGVCGMSRLSLRGIVASVTYVGVGVLSVALFRHVLGVI